MSYAFFRKLLRWREQPSGLTAVTALDLAMPDGDWVDFTAWYIRMLRNGSRLVVARGKDCVNWRFGWQAFPALGTHHYPVWDERQSFAGPYSARAAADVWLEETLNNALM